MAEVNSKIITKESRAAFTTHLRHTERSPRTIAAYIRTVRNLAKFLADAALTQDEAVRWKEYAVSRLQPVSVNAAISAVNAYAEYHRLEARLKRLKIQPRDELPAAQLLTHHEVDRLLSAAHCARLFYILRTFIMVGIRVGELRYVTVEALRKGELCITNKGKTRTLHLPKLLLKELRGYAKKL